ncbi:DUF4287 domain-containing protein [Lunatibacter salilacus]|uniref:DUF4287 domain-containing protein n=1 Tax=Lunatibacter salilacus TaxID=2483804 RepID=UPI001F21EE50|nr:DUF4287 domain-containing protein [Lunatibacter salilacus]
MIENLHKNSGKTLEEWCAIVKKENISKHGDIIQFLKDNHGLTYGFANLIAHKSKGSDAGSADNQEDLIPKQYKGKEHLKPIYDKLMAEIATLGDDIEISPKNAYVSLKRKKQFATLNPATKTRFAQRKEADCCSFTEYNEIRVEGSDFEQDSQCGIYKVFVDL